MNSNWASLLCIGLGAGPAQPSAAAAAELTGIVFVDKNTNGIRDPGEAGLRGVAISDQRDVVITSADGSFRIAAASVSAVLFVSVPDGYRSVGPFWRPIDPTGTQKFHFALAPAPASPDFIFIHASDTHLSADTLARTQRFRTIAESLKPAFILITGDLVKDALRVTEAEAIRYYDLFQAEARRFTAPLWLVPGNHEIFGIERHLSLVPANHPLYGRAMYRKYFGPDYYSFTFGGIHFIGLNSVDIDDLWYYGHIDSTQLEWLSRDLAAVPAEMPVVTFNHIPFFTAVETISGYKDELPAPSVITVRGKTSFRHSVSNAAEVIARIKGHPYDLALAGHMHVRENLRFEGTPIRFSQAPAVVGPRDAAGLQFSAGIIVHHVKRGRIDDGRFIPF